MHTTAKAPASNPLIALNDQWAVRLTTFRRDGRPVATPVNWNQGDECIIAPSLTNEAAQEKFPGGWKTLKPYLRTVAQPQDEPVTEPAE